MQDPRPRLLIVDDERMVRDSLAALLTCCFQVDVAENGAVGLARMAERHYDLILSDVEMPVMDGLQMLDLARQRLPGIESRVLFLTGSARGLDELDRMECPCLVKPVPVGELRRTLASMLSATPGEHAAHLRTEGRKPR